MERPYSYHTFLFPFLWKTDLREMREIDDFCNYLTKDGEIYWKETVRDANKTADAEYYSESQYFKKDAAKVLLDTNNKSLVKHFQLESCFKTTNFARKVNTETNSIVQPCLGKYTITKVSSSGDIVYELDINGVLLSVYNTGVALLTLELEYWGDKTVSGKPAGKPCPKDANAINEYGRRVTFPFVGEKGYPHPVCADRIDIRIGNFHKFEDFAKTIEEFHKNLNNDNKKQLSTHFIMRPLRYLLSLQDIFTTDPKDAADSKEKVFVEPIIDDRMYVCSIILDSDLSRVIKAKKTNGEYKIFSNPEIYKFAFIDAGDDPTCQSARMMNEIMHRCVYDRWIDYGTCDIITHHSFVRITSSAAGHVINSFLSQYTKMASLAVIQRATLVALESRCSSGQDISKLQEEYVEAQKNILIDECTVQEQGIEEFIMLQKELFIKERTESLDKRIREICELENLKSDKENLDQDKKQNIIILLLTIFSTLAVVTEILGFLFSDAHMCAKNISIVLMATIIVLGSWLGWMLFRKKKNNKR